MSGTAPDMRSHRYLTTPSPPGAFDGEGVSGSIIEAAGRARLNEPVARRPAEVLVDKDFSIGPTFLMRLAGGYVDPATGFAFDARRRFVRETAMVAKYADAAERLYPQYDFDNAYPIRNAEVAVASNQRMNNYCRWWLDSLSKLYLFDRHDAAPAKPATVTLFPPLETAFQRASLELIGQAPGPALPQGRLVQGDLLLTTGLTFGGGQNISPLVRDYAKWILERSGLTRLHAPGPGRRLFVSRSRTSMRRILNEAELTPGLAQRGFDIVTLETLPLHQQIAQFARADVIVSAHGAGLTNVMFCRPGALLIEIFPDIGVHSSAFRRIGTHVGIDYALYAGRSVEAGDAPNPRNVDLTVEPEDLFAFIDQLVSPRAPAVASAGGVV